MRILSTIFLFFTFISFSQNIESHQWENRILVIYTADKNSKELENQLFILSKNKEELLDRKLMIYSFTKNEFRFQFEEYWQKSTIMDKRYIDKKQAFKIFLLGLDGEVKLKQTSVVSSEKLLAIIDGMPMRKREVSNKN
ncbi:DUF4174 domain-containing protein [Polaribacter litorisediminis]|uniref:DUF4174 domain-containing protein n=1 Tax=Polaribacter litorisediminis TaxID=1908341 RepID=UPI001CC0F0E7|nr:DUF4174 domain-containing protein [Polaribacter litorisediminis]UAM98770.1 DUF4174 domain-containing protein [Polaribacter litorisediminis]